MVPLAAGIAANVRLKKREVQAPGAVVLDVAVLVPESLAGEGMSAIRLKINGTDFNVEASAASLEFEYVGTQILYVTPGSGMLNPGSGGIEINVVVLNLPADLYGLEIRIGGEPCSMRGISQSPSELGVASSISCLASELPLSKVGVIYITATSDYLTKALRSQ